MADEPPERDVLPPRRQLPGDLGDARGGNLADDLVRAAGVELDRDVSEERRRQLGRDVGGPGGLQQTCDPGAQQRAERALPNRRDEACREELARGGEPGERLAVRVEQPLGDVLAQRAQVGSGTSSRYARVSGSR